MTDEPTTEHCTMAEHALRAARAHVESLVNAPGSRSWLAESALYELDQMILHVRVLADDIAFVANGREPQALVA